MCSTIVGSKAKGLCMKKRGFSFQKRWLKRRKVGHRRAKVAKSERAMDAMSGDMSSYVFDDCRFKGQRAMHEKTWVFRTKTMVKATKGRTSKGEGGEEREANGSEERQQAPMDMRMLSRNLSWRWCCCSCSCCCGCCCCCGFYCFLL